MRRAVLPCALARAVAHGLTLSAMLATASHARETGAPVFKTACVAADHALASEAGLEILRAGGNAVDAAVATSFALSVVRPYSCGIGGGGFMVIHLTKHPKDPALGTVTTAIDYRETGIAACRPDYFEHDPDPDASTHGGKAVCVPGNVAGLLYALEKYGRLDRKAVLAPAIRLAEQGFVVDRHYAHTMKTDDLVLPWFAKDPARAARFPFLWERMLLKGAVKEGDRIHVPEQAAALRAIAEQGAAAFYKGDIAREIVRSVKAAGGEMTMDDLAGYTVKEREPLRAMCRGKTILTMPPPSSGGVAIAQMLGILQARGMDFNRTVRLPPPQGGHNSPPYVHLVTEAMKHAYADRARWMADPDFVKVPVPSLLDPVYIRGRADTISLNQTLAPEDYGSTPPPPDDAGTSHLCVVDADGSAVACTETINLIFGSFVAVEKYGFILNDEMDDFLSRKGERNAFGLAHGDANRPQPGKRPLSSMTPTIVLDTKLDGTLGPVQIVVGGSGGPRIISGTMQAMLNVLIWDMPAAEAVASPRFHHQWQPDKLQLETAMRDPELEKALKALGHTVAEREAVGNIQLIRAGQGGGWQGASDPRKGGEPAGY